MARSFDVAARLAESRPAVDHLQDYVRACGQLGYQHPDLTRHAYQLEEWYGSEDGLDLRALDADCTALRTAAAMTHEALSLQDQHRTVLAGAWQGLGATTSLEVLRRHGTASVAAADGLRAAGDELAALRDELWQLVDAKAAAVQAIDDRRGLQRGQWLAAANTVTTGAGDQSLASELVDQDIKPFVDNDVRDELVAELRGSLAAVAASFEKATAGLAACPAPPFEAPGALTESAVSPAAQSSPWTASAAPPSSPPGAPPPPAPDVAATAPAAAPPPAPVPPPLPSPAGGVSESGGALSGLGRQLAGLLGGVFDSSGDTLADLRGGGEFPDSGELGSDADEDVADDAHPAADTEDAHGRSEDDEAIDEPEDDEPEDDEPEDDEPEDDEPEDDESEGDYRDEDTEAPAPQENPDDSEAGAVPPDEDLDAVGDDSAAPPAAPLAAEAPAATPPPIGPAPVAAPPVPADLPGPTPCEIAADELPHAGE